jgi:hypothetical protein
MVENYASGNCDQSNNPFDPLNPSCVDNCYAFGGDQVQLVTNPGWGGFYYGGVSCDN